MKAAQNSIINIIYTFMTKEPNTQPNIFKIASMRFKTVVAEAGGRRSVTLTLPTDPDVQGFIVLLQPTLPSIF